MNKDLSKDFYRYVLPSMVSMLLSGFYSMVDGIFVGNAAGSQALAAINLVYPIQACMNATAFGLGVGGAVLEILAHPVFQGLSLTNVDNLPAFVMHQVHARAQGEFHGLAAQLFFLLIPLHRTTIQNLSLRKKHRSSRCLPAFICLYERETLTR